jgi:membrane protein
MSLIKSIFNLFKETFNAWNEDKAPRLAAALAYYTIFSIAPFLIVVIAVAGLAFGQDAVRGRLDEQIQGLVGREGADMIQELIQNVRRPSENIWATAIGIGTLLLGAGGVFGQLQDALNTVWGITTKPGRGIVAIIKDRFLSFTMVIGVGFLLMVSLVVSTILASVKAWVLGLMPGTEFILQIVTFLVSFGIITLLFALMYRFVPDVDIEWRDVWVGAAFTALLFEIGKTLLGLYLGNSGVLSTYGAAGSVVIILLWIFYSAQILLFGAEFTQVYAQKYGSHIQPSDNAIAITPEARARQGLPEGEKPIIEEAKEKEAVGLMQDYVVPADIPPTETSKRPLALFRNPIAMGAAFFGLLLGMLIGSRPAEDK